MSITPEYLSTLLKEAIKAPGDPRLAFNAEQADAAAPVQLDLEGVTFDDRLNLGLTGVTVESAGFHWDGYWVLHLSNGTGLLLGEEELCVSDGPFKVERYDTNQIHAENLLRLPGSVVVSAEAVGIDGVLLAFSNRMHVTILAAAGTEANWALYSLAPAE